jgi:hypothetical protein
MVALRMSLFLQTNPLAENAVLLSGRSMLRYCGAPLLEGRIRPMVTEIRPSTQ